MQGPHQMHCAVVFLLWGWGRTYSMHSGVVVYALSIHMVLPLENVRLSYDPESLCVFVSFLNVNLCGF